MLPNVTAKSSNLITQSLMLKVWRMLKQHGLISLGLYQWGLLCNCQTFFTFFGPILEDRDFNLRVVTRTRLSFPIISFETKTCFLSMILFFMKKGRVTQTSLLSI